MVLLIFYYAANFGKNFRFQQKLIKKQNFYKQFKNLNNFGRKNNLSIKSLQKLTFLNKKVILEFFENYEMMENLYFLNY